MMEIKKKKTFLLNLPLCNPFPPRESVFIFRIGFDLYILGRGRPGPEAPQGPVPLLQPPPQVVEPTLEFYFIFLPIG